MRSFLALIIFADGAAAFIGAILASRMRTSQDKRPEIARILMVGLFGYAAARFWNGWNLATHGQEVAECVRLQSPDYLWHSFAALTLQASTAWGASLYLVVALMNGHADRFRNRLGRLARNLRKGSDR